MSGILNTVCLTMKQDIRALLRGIISAIYFVVVDMLMMVFRCYVNL